MEKRIEMLGVMHKLAKVDRKKAIIFNREIKLRIKRGELLFYNKERSIYGTEIKSNDFVSVIDSFDWDETRQGWDFWDDFLSDIEESMFEEEEEYEIIDN